MPAPPGWDATAAVAACRIVARRRNAWRAHNRRYAATASGGSLQVSGRYNRGLDLFPPDEAWPALYLGLSEAICLGEILRHLTPARFAALSNYRLTQVRVQLSAVVDCWEPARLGLKFEDLCEDMNYRAPQAIARAAIDRGAEGILVPSATRLGHNLIIFPHCLRPSSRIAVVRSVDPRIYVDRHVR